MAKEPNEKLKVGGHHSDFDELTWLQTYRAMAATKDEILPQSEAEARFVDQMLGNQPIQVTRPEKLRRHATAWVFVAVLALVVVAFVIGQITSNNRRDDVAAEAPRAPVTEPAPEPTTTLGPNYSLAPYDRRADEVIAEMLAIAAKANPGLIWFGTHQPTLTDCTLPNGHPGQSGALEIRWSLGDYDAIQTGPVEGNVEWHLIQQANDQADDKMLEAWIGEPITSESAARFGIDSMKGNWYFGYVFPGLSHGSSTFDLNDGEGILALETLCLQPSTPEPPTPEP